MVNRVKHPRAAQTKVFFGEHLLVWNNDRQTSNGHLEMINE